MSAAEPPDAEDLIESAFEGIELPEPHQWVHVLVLPLTDEEARHVVDGGRRSYQLDTTDPKRLRSQTVMCAVCKFVPSTLTEMLIPCQDALDA